MKDLAPGTVIGGYRIEALLGRGGMGDVYRAIDERQKRPVALKVLVVSSDPTAADRFEREARAVAAIDDPHVVGVYSSGEERGLSFIALEHLTGGTLADRLHAGGALPWTEAAKLGAQVARGLAALHAAGLVHRDLKPENVLLDAEGRAKVSDLGLVRSERTGESRLTEENTVVGTPAYLSPEQADGRDATPASDLYALGATLYALCAGGPPFEGSVLQLLMKHLTETPAPLRSRAPGVPVALEALVARLLAKEPARRGPGPAAIAAELEAIASLGEKTGGVKDAPPRASVGALVAVVALAAIAFLATARSGPPIPPAPSPPLVPEHASPTTASVPSMPSAASGRPALAPGLSGPLTVVSRIADGPSGFVALDAASSGHFVVGTRRDGSLWFFENREVLQAIWRVPVGLGELSSVAISPDGGRIVTAGEDGDVRQYWAHGEVGRVTQLGPSAGRVALAFAPEGDRFVAAFGAGQAIVVSLHGVVLEHFQLPRGGLARLAWTGTALYACKDDTTPAAFLNGALRPLSGKNAGTVTALAVARTEKDTERVFAAGKAIRMWQMKLEREELTASWTSSPIDPAVVALVALDKARHVAAALEDGRLALYTTRSIGASARDPVGALVLADDAVTALAPLGDGANFVAGTRRGALLHLKVLPR